MTLTQKSLTAHTWTCDIPDCKDTVTAYGEHYAEDNGWLTKLILFEGGCSYDMDSNRPPAQTQYGNRINSPIDLCPDHKKQLMEFLCGPEDEDRER